MSSGSLMVWSFYFAHRDVIPLLLFKVLKSYWPSTRPDLNLIEHIWDELGRCVRQQVNPPQTLGDLEHALVEQWRHLPQAVFTNVLRSMRRRCVAVRDARGGHNRY